MIKFFSIVFGIQITGVIIGVFTVSKVVELVQPSSPTLFGLCYGGCFSILFLVIGGFVAIYASKTH